MRQAAPKTKTKRSYGSFTLDDAEAVDDVEEDGDDVKEEGQVSDRPGDLA